MSCEPGSLGVITGSAFAFRYGADMSESLIPPTRPVGVWQRGPTNFSLSMVFPDVSLPCLNSFRCRDFFRRPDSFRGRDFLRELDKLKFVGHSPLRVSLQFLVSAKTW